MGVDYAEYWIVVLLAKSFQCPIDLSHVFHRENEHVS